MLLCPWDSPGKNSGVGCHLPSPGDLLHPGIETAAPSTPSLQANSLPAEPQRGAGWGAHAVGYILAALFISAALGLCCSPWAL